MLSNNEIKGAFYKPLKDKFNLPIYFDEVTDGFLKPCFFVEIEQENTVSSSFNFLRSLSVSIIYYQDTASELDKMNKQQELILLFSPYVRIGDRKLTTEISQGTIYGSYIDVMRFNVNLQFYDNMLTAQIEEHVKNVDLNIYKGE